METDRENGPLQSNSAKTATRALRPAPLRLPDPFIDPAKPPLRPGATLAERKCAARGRDFAELFANQYVLSRDDQRSYPGFRKHPIGDWTLHHGPALPICILADANGAEIGCVAGFALTGASKVLRAVHHLGVAKDDPDFLDCAEREIAALSGKYIALLIAGGAERLYGDPVLDLPVLYDPETMRVASSLGILLDRPIRPHASFAARRVLKGKQTLGLGATLDAMARRAYANHYLDLAQFTQTRHWPTPDIDFTRSEDAIPDAADAIAERLGAHLGALIKRYPCVISMTGGFDSRMMLASALEHAGGVAEFAGFRFHAQSRKDCKIAERVMQRARLPFRHYFHTPYTQTQRRDMRLKMGWSGTRAELRAVGMIEKFPAGHMILRGNIMELLRANQWRRDKIGIPLHLVHALRRLRIADGASQGDVTGWRAAYQSWFRTLPTSARRKPYDFAFTELYLPNVQGPYINAHHRTPFINPFNDRHMIALATSLPAGPRMNGAVIKAIISRTHPELAEVPYV